MNLERNTEGGETARTGSVLFAASFVCKFPTLPHDASQTRFRLHFFTFPAREICFAPSGNPLKTRKLYQNAALPIKRVDLQNFSTTFQTVESWTYFLLFEIPPLADAGLSRLSMTTSGSFGERALPTTAAFDGQNENHKRKKLGVAFGVEAECRKTSRTR